ncbi:DNA replication and repair protein RecF, ABC family ATPase [Polaribacter irgensii 23-P]|uniref:DNA replication and repair protein RecF n=1 Tax=Polaribacter irgensii 23-P TaxID=313594 RepID=A4C1M9_9FLAO|nr:DNA replication/repair protein RecF [Polaribacter irgensii]EAR12032.1 DNA replication and repair protein RecF, ABC family ATPase [Polaribacter irgensii 23-P]
MYLKKISLLNFKNLEAQSFDFQQKINCFVGNNGVGKTNILDAIYYLSFAKSYFNSVAIQNIRHGASFFMVEGDYVIDHRNEKIVCSLKKGQKKVLKRNGKSYEKFSEHIGQLPLVIISPADRDLVTEGSDTRRKFIDGVISQQNKNYLLDLLAYNKVLTQRNALLKYFAANRTFDALNLSVYDAQLSEYGTRIYEVRKAFLEKFIPIFNEKYQVISNDKERVDLVYKSQLNDFSMNSLLQKSLEKDKILQYTTAGTHKDDLSFEIGDYPIKKFGSQGQQKSYLIALKFAQFEFIKQQSNVVPILLLDDIFDKLDESRVLQIINLVNNDEFGQIFITDTHSERTENIVKQSNKPYKIFKL